MSTWILYISDRYFFATEEIKKNWQEAENDCISRGGHLTSILSGEENNFLQEQMDKFEISSKW